MNFRKRMVVREFGYTLAAICPFYNLFEGIDSRRVDQALWQYGKFLKTTRLPKTRKDHRLGTTGKSP
jgi:hypothetical protein